MKLHEEFKLVEDMWEEGHAKTTSKSASKTTRKNKYSQELTESPKKAYNALMKVQAALASIPGWDIIDCTQEDSYSMLLKCDLDNSKGAYVWYVDDNDEIESYTESVEEVDNLCAELGVSMDIYDSDSASYTVKVYLTYEG